MGKTWEGMFEKAVRNDAAFSLAGPRSTGFSSQAQARQARRRSLHSARVLIIDDDPANRVLLEEILRAHGFAQIESVGDPRQSLPLFMTYKPDIILLDLNMPHLDGFGVMDQLMPRMSSDTPVPILMLTGDISMETRKRALASGASDFITKPFDPIDIKLRVENLLEARALQLQLRNHNLVLQDEVRKRTIELEEAHVEILQRLALAAEYRDDATGEHAQRVGRVAALLAQQLGLDRETVELIRRAAPLHDIGKIGIPDGILMKPGSLTPEEFEKVKEHAGIGAKILSGSETSLLQVAEEIALTHHEKWDGTGYYSLAGKNIPLSGRIVALADVFDALTHKRPYKEAWEIDDAIAEITQQSGRQFDPHVVGAFLQLVSSPEFVQRAEADPAPVIDLMADKAAG
jgi:putative two-component system response regulator